MDNSATTHWTNDEETLERFVLRRLTAAQRETLEAHLLTCRTCRARVDAEQHLVSSVRRYARTELKKRLRQKIQATELSPRFSWQKVAAIAAGFIIVVGVGIYTILLDKHEDTQFAYTDQDRSQRDMSPVSPPSVNKAQPTEEPRTMQKGFHESQPLSSGPQRANEKRGTKAAVAPQKPEKAPPSIAHVDAQESDRSRASEVASAPAIASARISKEKTRSATGKSESDVLWIDGVITAATPTAKTSTENKAARLYTVRQQPVSDLPPSVRPEKARGSDQRVLTLLERADGGLRITLFLDSLLGETDVQQARVETAPGDSLLVSVAQHRIIYHLPGGWISRDDASTRPQR